MRSMLLFVALVGAGLAVGCSDNNSHSADSHVSGQTSSNGEGTTLNINTEENAASFSDEDTTISINAEDSSKGQSK